MPFVGRSGQYLDRLILEEMGLTRADFYIANVVKCRPPGNRDPLPDEVAACSPWLEQQLDLIDPSVVVTLGNFATKLLLRTTEGITRLRGRVYPFRRRRADPHLPPGGRRSGAGARPRPRCGPTWCGPSSTSVPAERTWWYRRDRRPHAPRSTTPGRWRPQLAPLAKPGDLLLLAGDLGAGKTAFVQGFARGLGVTEPVTSPAFVLARPYHGRLTLLHLDVYRLEHIQELHDLGISELLDDGGVTVIEWGDVVAPALPADFLEVRMTPGDDDDERFLSIRWVGPGWPARAAAVRRAVAAWAVPARDDR